MTGQTTVHLVTGTTTSTRNTLTHSQSHPARISMIIPTHSMIPITFITPIKPLTTQTPPLPLKP
jgi:hypothetical protein